MRKSVDDRIASVLQNYRRPPSPWLYALALQAQLVFVFMFAWHLAAQLDSTTALASTTAQEQERRRVVVETARHHLLATTPMAECATGRPPSLN